TLGGYVLVGTLNFSDPIQIRTRPNLIRMGAKKRTSPPVQGPTQPAQGQAVANRALQPLHFTPHTNKNETQSHSYGAEKEHHTAPPTRRGWVGWLALPAAGACLLPA